MKLTCWDDGYDSVVDGRTKVTPIPITVSQSSEGEQPVIILSDPSNSVRVCFGSSGDGIRIEKDGKVVHRDVEGRACEMDTLGRR